MGEWKEYKYTDLCTLIGGGTPKTSEPMYWGGKIPWLSVKDFGNDEKYVYKTEKTITEAGLNNSSTKLLNKDDIIISARGTIGAIAMLASEMAFNQSCFGIRSNNLSDQHFLYYLTKTKIGELRKSSHGSVFDTITRDTFEKIDCLIPPLQTQQKIASILSSLDDKMEVNRRISENLEQQAQALFKSWFVDFEPFKNGEFVESELGMIPKGWRVYRLSDFLPVITGKKDANVAKGGKYPFFSCSQDILWTDNYSFDGNAILVAGNGDFNVKTYSGKFEAYQRTYVLIPYNPIYTAWLFYAVKFHLSMIISAARGSVIKFITKGNLADFKFSAPSKMESETIIEKFDLINNKIAKLKEENDRLATLRDTLLPKLMSGELKVNEL